MKKGLRIAIVNPTTLVGNELKTLLRERKVTYSHLDLLDSTGERVGAITEMDDEPALVGQLTEDSLNEVDLVFFCGPAAANEPWLERREGDRFTAIDLSQPSAAHDAPVIIAGLNDDRLTESTELVVSPHPMTIPVAIIVQQLRKRFELELCAVSVIQPASEFDQPGVDELAQQSLALLAVRGVKKEVFDRQLAFNLYPATNGSQQEEYVARQVRQIIASELAVSVSVTQGTIFHSHSFNMFVKLKGKAGETEIAALLAEQKMIEVSPADDPAGTTDAAGRDEILVGRIQADASIKGAFWIWAVSDNLRRGSALNAVLIAEEILARRGQKVN